MAVLVSVFFACLIVATSKAQNVTVSTGVGTIVGEVASVKFNGVTHNFKQFLGIPYAEAPVAERRFKKPTRKSNFTEPFIAKTMPPICPQNNGYLDFFGISLSRDLQSDDCLRLNIFTPEEDVHGTNKRAVMVWIHGGFYEVENQNWYLATMLAASRDIIYVTVNYRLSALGFLSTGDDRIPGNNGLWDQHMALQWVHDNIGYFGGDPGKVTIAGESAGGAAVIHHALYRGSQNLFQRVLTQSGSANNMFMFERNPHAKFSTFVNRTGCFHDKHEEVMACLQSKSFIELLDQTDFDLAFPPVIDGEFVIIDPVDMFSNNSDRAAEILSIYGEYDILFGFNSGEGNFLSGLLDGLFPSGGDVVSKYTQESFEMTVIPFALRFTKVTDTPTLRDSIVHQYINWAVPKDHSKIRQSSVNLMSDLAFTEGIIRSAMVHSQTGSGGSTYLYVFDQRSRISFDDLLGVSHAEELIFALGFPLNQLINFYGISFNDPAEEFNSTELKLSEDMMDYWTNFVKTGDPSEGSDGPSTLTVWPEYDVTSQRYIRFKGGLDDFPIESRYTAARLRFWHEFVPVIHDNCDKQCETCKTDVSSGISISPAKTVYGLALAAVLFGTLEFVGPSR